LKENELRNSISLESYMTLILEEFQRIRIIDPEVLYKDFGKTSRFGICKEFVCNSGSCIGCPLNPRFGIDLLINQKRYRNDFLPCWGAICLTPESIKPKELKKLYEEYLIERIANLFKISDILYKIVEDNFNNLRSQIGKTKLAMYVTRFKELEPFNTLALEAWNQFLYLQRNTKEEIESNGYLRLLKLRIDLQKKKETLSWWYDLLTGSREEDISITIDSKFLGMI